MSELWIKLWLLLLLGLFFLNDKGFWVIYIWVSFGVLFRRWCLRRGGWVVFIWSLVRLFLVRFSLGVGLWKVIEEVLGWEVGVLGFCFVFEINLLCGFGGYLGYSFFICLRRCEIMVFFLFWSFLEYVWIDFSRKYCWIEKLI